MMEVYRTPSKESREFILANVTYEAVIEGLNGYFASEPRNDYITVKMESDKQNFALYEAEAWADILISWLRTKHEIFYYPEIGSKESGIEDLKEHITLLEADLKKVKMEVEEARKKHWNDLRDIHKALGRDGTCDSIDGFAKAVKARAEYVESLSRNAEREAQKSDTNKLIRECCTKHDIVVPSRYLSDEACIEYLFSVSVSILQDLYRDIFKKQPDGLSAKDIANKILDKVLTTEDLLHKSVDSVNKECKATGRLMVEDYKLKLKDYILKDIEEHGYRYDGLQTKSIEEIVDWIITMATSDHSFIVLKDIYTTVVSPAERLRYKDCDRPTVDHMKDYILRRFEGLHANIEYCLKKMSELDGHKKNFEILKEKQEFLSKQNMELSCKLCAKDDEISRLKDLINAMNEEVEDM